MWYQTVDPDPVETVSSVLPGYHLHCPDVASVDQHIAERWEHLGPRSNLTPKYKEAARQDIDRLLLDRRLYLMLVSHPGSFAGSPEMIRAGSMPAAGVKLPRVSRNQYHAGQKVPISHL
jgi:hypothetical protein